MGNQCDCKQYYDGNKDGILYIQENYLVTHDFVLHILAVLQFNKCMVFGCVSAFNLACNTFYSTYSLGLLDPDVHHAGTNYEQQPFLKQKTRAKILAWLAVNPNDLQRLKGKKENLLN